MLAPYQWPNDEENMKNLYLMAYVDIKQSWHLILFRRLDESIVCSMNNGVPNNVMIRCNSHDRAEIVDGFISRLHKLPSSPQYGVAFVWGRQPRLVLGSS